MKPLNENLNVGLGFSVHELLQSAFRTPNSAMGRWVQRMVLLNLGFLNSDSEVFQSKIRNPKPKIERVRLWAIPQIQLRPALMLSWSRGVVGCWEVGFSDTV